MALGELFSNGSVSPTTTSSPFTPGWNYGFLHNIPNLKRFEDIEGGPPQPGALESFTDGENVYNVSRQVFEDGSSNGAFPVAITKRALANFDKKNGIYNGVKEGSFGQVLNPDGTVQSEGLYHPTRDSEELKKWGTGIAAAVGLILGGQALVGAGAGSAGGAAAGSGAGGAVSSTFGGFGSGALGTSGAGTAFGSGITAGEGLGAFGGLGAGAGFGSTFGGSMAGLGAAGGSSGLFSGSNNNFFTRQLGKQGLKQILSGVGGGSSGGQGQTSNGGGGGMNMNYGDMANIFASLYDANQQGKASDSMRQWMNEQQNYVRNYGNEGTPEFNYLKKTLEAKDAAAGRNSQYGPRTADLLGQLGKDKLEATARMALGFASPLQKALNQNASKYAGSSAALQKFLNGGSQGSGRSLLDILGGNSGTNGLGNYSTDGTPVNGDFFDGDFFGDSGADPGWFSGNEAPVDGDWFDSDIMSFMDGWE